MPKDEWARARAQKIAERKNRKDVEALQSELTPEVAEALRRQHSISVSEHQDGNEVSNLTRCPRCNCPIRVDRLTRHLRKVHLEEKGTSNRDGTVSRRPTISQMELNRTVGSVRSAVADLQIQLEEIREQLEIIRDKAALLSGELNLFTV